MKKPTGADNTDGQIRSPPGKLVVRRWRRNLRASRKLVGAVGFEQPPKNPGKTADCDSGGAQSGALSELPNTAESGLADLIQQIMALPLSDQEKAEAVRLLIRSNPVPP